MDLFKGTAWYYARFRHPYPEELLSHLVQRFRPGPGDRLLDLGCGTGHLAIPLADRFAEVVGMDPEPEMLAVAEEQARAAGVDNIDWVEGGSGDLQALRPRLGRFRLVTMGSSFHWTDREATLQELASLVSPGGGIAVISGGMAADAPEEFQQTAQKVIKRWLGEERRAGSGTYQHPRERHEAIIARSPFGRMESYRTTRRYTRTVDTIIGSLYSTSYCSPAVLGEKKEPFERELRAALLQLNPAGEFPEVVSYEALLAWKP